MIEMPGKAQAKKSRGRGRKSRAGPTNVPTIAADPKFRMTVRLVDESDEGLPFQGDLTYKHLMAAVARQIHSHLPTPIAMEASEIAQWSEKFLTMFHWVQIHSSQAWGTPFVDADPGTSTRFEYSLHPVDENVRAPPPAKIDTAAGASDRPFASVKGGTAFFADQLNMDHRFCHCTSVDVIDVQVSIW